MLNISQLLTPKEHLEYLKQELKELNEYIQELSEERDDVIREIGKLENNIKL